MEEVETLEGGIKVALQLMTALNKTASHSFFTHALIVAKSIVPPFVNAMGKGEVNGGMIGGRANIGLYSLTNMCSVFLDIDCMNLLCRLDIIQYDAACRLMQWCKYKTSASSGGSSVFMYIRSMSFLGKEGK